MWSRRLLPGSILYEEVKVALRTRLAAGDRAVRSGPAEIYYVSFGAATLRATTTSPSLERPS